MIKTGNYTIQDILNLVLPFIKGEIYQTMMNFRNEYFLIQVKPYRFAKGIVYVKKISSKRNINGLLKEENYPRQNSLMGIPLDLFKSQFYRVL